MTTDGEGSRFPNVPGNTATRVRGAMEATAPKRPSRSGPPRPSNRQFPRIPTDALSPGQVPDSIGAPLGRRRTSRKIGRDAHTRHQSARANEPHRPIMPPPPIPSRPKQHGHFFHGGRYGDFDYGDLIRPRTHGNFGRPGDTSTRWPPPTRPPQQYPRRPHQSLPGPPIEHSIATMKHAVPDGMQDPHAFPDQPARKQPSPAASSVENATQKPASNSIQDAPSVSRKKSAKGSRKENASVPCPNPNKRKSICRRGTKGLSLRSNVQPNIPRRTSSIRGSMRSPEDKPETGTEVNSDDREVADRDVLRGLHIAASAACDEDVDVFVRNKTGLRIRRFLADLMILETLNEEGPNEDTEQWARRRRADMRKLKQHVRRSREIGMSGAIP